VWIAACGVIFLAVSGIAQERSPDTAFSSSLTEFYRPGDPVASQRNAIEERSRALVLYQRALKKQRVGESEDALEAYREIIEILPNDSSGVAQRAASILAAEGNYDEAQQLLEDAIENSQDSVRPLLALSNFAINFGNKKEGLRERGIEAADQALEQFPQSLAAIRQRISLHRAAGEIDQARDLLRAAHTRSVEDAPQLIQLARIARSLWPLNKVGARAANMAELNRFYESALKAAGPKDSATRIAVGQYFVNSEQYDKAKSAYEDIIKRRPDLLEQRFRLADVRKALGDVEGHIADLVTLSEIDPFNALTHKKLSDLFAEKDDLDRTLLHLQRALELKLGKHDDYIKLCKLLLYGKNDAATAVNVGRRATILFPNSSMAHFFLGIAQREDGEPGEAVPSFVKAEALADDEDADLTLEFYFEFGATLERAGDIDGASSRFKQALEKVPDDDPVAGARIYNYLGYMWLERELHVDQAGEMIKHANELVPDVSAYVDSLGWFHFVKGNFEEAERHLAHAYELLTKERDELYPEDAVILEHLAMAQKEQGKLREAQKTLKEAAELAPNSPSIRKHLDDLLSTKPQGSE